jgi:hypothetical protein
MPARRVRTSWGGWRQTCGGLDVDKDVVPGNVGIARCVHVVDPARTQPLGHRITDGGRDYERRRMRLHMDRCRQFWGQALLDLHAVRPDGARVSGEAGDGVYPSVWRNSVIYVDAKAQLLKPSADISQYGLVRGSSAFITTEHAEILNRLGARRRKAPRSRARRASPS